MALPTGLLPVLVFALTVGVATPVTLSAHMLDRRGTASFAAALRSALVGTGVVYLLGVVVWVVAGGGPLWEVAATLLVAGVASLLLLTALPLLVGRWLVRRARGIDPDTALRFATYGWSVAMLVVFGVFVAPGGLAGGNVLHLDVERICVVGFCGIAVPLLAAVLLELVVAVLGPGVVGLVLHARTAGRERRTG